MPFLASPKLTENQRFCLFVFFFLALLNNLSKCIRSLAVNFNDCKSQKFAGLNVRIESWIALITFVIYIFIFNYRNR